MKKYRLFGIICIFLSMFSCEKDDTDLDVNSVTQKKSEKSKGNSGSSNKKGGDYGDLYILNRDDAGIPYLGIIGDVWYAEVLDSYGGTAVLEVDADGELVDSDRAEEVELGRINLIRSPASVLVRGLLEAKSALEAADYITTDYCGRLVAVHGGLDWLEGVEEEDDKTIDSPRENLAIYKELMTNGFYDEDGKTQTLTFILEGDDNENTIKEEDLLLLAASAFAAGSDKTGTILIDEVVYANLFLGISTEGFNTFSDSDNSLLYDATDGSENFDNYTYYNQLLFYNYTDDFEYDRVAEYSDKMLYIQDLNGRAETVSVFQEVFNSIKYESKNNIADFTAACDDAVQVLEYVHDPGVGVWVEYLGD